MKDTTRSTYDKYVALYKSYHADNQGGRTVGYSGRSVLKQLGAIQKIAREVDAKTMLDYGCGRGEQYQWRNFPVGKTSIPSLAEYFDIKSISLFDPAVPEHMSKPDGTYDLVICTDVLEHVHESDIPGVLREIIGFAKKGVFLSIACYKAGTTLPNGENAHITIRNKIWWTNQIAQAKAQEPSVRVDVVLKYKIRFHKRFKIKWSKQFTVS